MAGQLVRRACRHGASLSSDKHNHWCLAQVAGAHLHHMFTTSQTRQHVNLAHTTNASDRRPEDDGGTCSLGVPGLGCDQPTPGVCAIGVVLAVSSMKQCLHTCALYNYSITANGFAACNRCRQMCVCACACTTWLCTRHACHTRPVVLCWLPVRGMRRQTKRRRLHEKKPGSSTSRKKGTRPDRPARTGWGWGGGAARRGTPGGSSRHSPSSSSYSRLCLPLGPGMPTVQRVLLGACCQSPRRPNNGTAAAAGWLAKKHPACSSLPTAYGMRPCHTCWSRGLTMPRACPLPPPPNCRACCCTNPASPPSVAGGGGGGGKAWARAICLPVRANPPMRPCRCARRVPPSGRRPQPAAAAPWPPQRRRTCPQTPWRTLRPDGGGGAAGRDPGGGGSRRQWPPNVCGRVKASATPV